jgi:hypothetical protein
MAPGILHKPRRLKKPLMHYFRTVFFSAITSDTNCEPGEGVFTFIPVILYEISHKSWESEFQNSLRRHLHIWALLFSNQKFSNCTPTVDVGFIKHTSDSFCGNRALKMYTSCCHVTRAAVLLWFFEISFSTHGDLFLSMLIFAHRSSSLMLSSHDSCMLT